MAAAINATKSAPKNVKKTAVKANDQIDGKPVLITQSDDGPIITPVAAEADKKAALSTQLMTVTVPAKETDQTLIVPKSVNGKDRWFAKDAMRSFKKLEDGQFEITATRREFAYRDMETLAHLV